MVLQMIMVSTILLYVTMFKLCNPQNELSQVNHHKQLQKQCIVKLLLL